MDGVVISGELGYGKPDPRMFAAALAILGTQATQTVMVGDSAQRDVAAAQRSGMRAIWVSHGRMVPEKIRPDGCIASATALEAELDRFEQGSLAASPHDCTD